MNGLRLVFIPQNNVAAYVAEWRNEMIASTEHKLYKSMTKTCKGSILKRIRTNKGMGKGLIAGAIVLLVFTLPVTVLCLFAKAGVVASVLISAPGLLLLILGIYQKNKRASSWMSYYQEQSGFSEGELQQVDRELLSPSITIVTCRMGGAAVENYIAGYFTEHYVVIDGVYPYLRRLEDIIAVAFSDSTDIWRMVILSVHDRETESVTLVTDTSRKKTLCMELMQEMHRRNPKILCGQEIVCDGGHYILERDGAQILRLYQEGHTLELAR